MVRAAGIEPAQTFRSYGFSYHLGFRRHREVFVVIKAFAMGVASLVSTPFSRWRPVSGLPISIFSRNKQFVSGIFVVRVTDSVEISPVRSARNPMRAKNW